MPTISGSRWACINVIDRTAKLLQINDLHKIWSMLLTVTRHLVRPLRDGVTYYHSTG